MTRHTYKLRKLFENGNYGEVLQSSSLAEINTLPAAEAAAYIGALAFQGRVLEAETALKLLAPSAQSALTAAAFFLGVAYCRQSRYAAARSVFAELLLRSRQNPTDAQLKFFAHQGTGLLRFYENRFRLVHAHGEKAFVSSTLAAYPYGVMLAQDLLAHAQLNLGKISEGLSTLEQARKHARKHGFKAVETSLVFTLLKVRAQYGYSPQTIIAELKEAANRLSPSDTYSLAEIQIENAKQLWIRGEFASARHALQNVLPEIYAQKNRRQSARANLLMAHMMLSQNEFYQALALTSAASGSIDEKTEPLLYSQWLTMENRIRKAIGTAADSASLELLLQKLSARMQHRMNQQVLERYWHIPCPAAPKGEDPLGDLISGLQRKSLSALKDAVANGYFGLISEYWIGFRSPTGIALDLEPTSAFVRGRERCLYVPALSAQMRKLLLVLATTEVSKEEITHKVWGYAYDPLRHDALIYTTITRLKALLAGTLTVGVSERGYRLVEAPEISFCGASNTADSSSTTLATSPAQADNAPGLSYRQQLALKWIAGRPAVSSHDYAQEYRVNRMTAFRDLSALCEQGLIRKLGRGKATRYSL